MPEGNDGPNPCRCIEDKQDSVDADDLAAKMAGRVVEYAEQPMQREVFEALSDFAFVVTAPIDGLLCIPMPSGDSTATKSSSSTATSAPFRVRIAVSAGHCAGMAAVLPFLLAPVSIVPFLKTCYWQWEIESHRVRGVPGTDPGHAECDGCGERTSLRSLGRGPCDIGVCRLRRALG
jgi:hypothetical protein